MRGLCAVSHLKRVQKDVCTKPVSLGSLSATQGDFDPELLEQVFLELASKIPTSWGDARLAHPASTTASSKNSASTASHLFSASATNREWKSSRNSPYRQPTARQASPGKVW